MCELFGISASKKQMLNVLLGEFFSHGIEHPHGWGMAFFYGNAVSLEKQPENSCKSSYLKQRLRTPIETDRMIAHIRLATRGGMEYEDTHPFVKRDNYNRVWTLAHNGTIFECEKLDSFIHVQHGRTDSERILCYIISKINKAQEKKNAPLLKEERFQLVDEILCEISSENKINLILDDGELYYIHTNYKDSLFQCHKEGITMFSTKPLGRECWENVPMNRLLAYQKGQLCYTGTNHGCEFFDSEEKMRLLFLDYAVL